WASARLPPEAATATSMPDHADVRVGDHIGCLAKPRRRLSQVLASRASEPTGTLPTLPGARAGTIVALHGLADRELWCDRKHAHGSAGLAGRLDRLVVRTAVRFGCLVRGAGRIRRAWALGASAHSACARDQAALSRQYDDPGNRVHLRWRRGARHRLHALGRGPLRRGVNRPRSRRRGARGDAPRRALRVRCDTPWVTPAPDGVRFTAGPDTVLVH